MLNCYRRKQEKEIKSLRQEIDILRKIYHENVIQLLDSFETSAEFCIVTELAQGQLYEILEEDKKLPETEIKFLARQLVSGLFYLHSNNIIHRDIKPQNVLISANGIVKICDFGFARAIESKTMITSIKGTPLYMAPELLREYPYNQKADLWSLGVILYELFVGQPPFYTDKFPTLMAKIINENVKYPDTMSFQFKDFLKGLLVKNPKERCDWNNIIDHPFIKENDGDKQYRIQVQENYRKWIIRLKNEKVFNLYECETFLSKFSSDSDVESGTRAFSAFDSGDKATPSGILTTGGHNANGDQQNQGKQTVTAMKRTDSVITNNQIKDPYWDEIESKITKEEYSTSLRKDPEFSRRISATLMLLVSKENDRQSTSSDKKLLIQLVRLLFATLTKGKFENQNLDITKNQDILASSMSIFLFCQQEEEQSLLNDIIKVIGLFAKFYCYYSNGVDLSFCATFIKYVPAIVNGTSKPSSVHINIIKAVGIMITVANMFPKRSLMFFRTFHDCNLIGLLLNVIKVYKNVSTLYNLVKSAIDCLAIFVNPMNGDIFVFPSQKSEAEKQDYAEFKTPFEHINTIRSQFCQQFIESGMNDIFPVLFEVDSEGSLKSAVLRVS